MASATMIQYIIGSIAMVHIKCKPFSPVYFESYGCQMNVNDTEVAWAVLEGVGYSKTSAVDEVCTLLVPAAVSPYCLGSFGGG